MTMMDRLMNNPEIIYHQCCPLPWSLERPSVGALSSSFRRYSDYYFFAIRQMSLASFLHPPVLDWLSADVWRTYRLLGARLVSHDGDIQRDCPGRLNSRVTSQDALHRREVRAASCSADIRALICLNNVDKTSNNMWTNINSVSLINFSFKTCWPLKARITIITY